MSSVAIECFLEEVPAYPPDAAVVGIDVIRSTTTAITCVESGRRCYPVPTLDEAVHWRDLLDRAILVGELGGNQPYGFDLNNSPAAIAIEPDPSRPAVLLSTSGTRLLALAAERYAPTFVASLRNWEAQAAALVAEAPETVVLLGAGTRGEFREEDQLCCAWIAARLLDAGFSAADATRDIVERWRDAPVEAITQGRSATYLRDSGQSADLDFILAHVADLQATYEMRAGEVIRRESRDEAG